ncbi:hypothetical protein K402DRAFT_397886 [Aulographum hederae CBS 113979]|uniref:Uncharacterized protein n=1 Tax=Aulographum hederae CBS 113979 TaxID=1176131 RepID=A0A6G1GN19_9PEZI|nr:hypothetical protein K402DRAFT_397886 [Aulographum hederae CBS 113979]
MISLSPKARLVFQNSFARLEQAVSPDDARDFQSTTLRDVRSAVMDMERQLALKKSLKNFSRIKPLLDSLEYFSKTIEVLCNGTPFLPWVWVRDSTLAVAASC